MNYLKISNQGIIDKNALMLLGASTKRGDNTKIGMFGSGNKYALAYLLRNNYEIKLFAGLKEIKLGVQNMNWQNQDFQLITVDDVSTNITTDFGKDWQMWQAIREIYCNAIDEGSQKLEYVNKMEPEEGFTHFYIKTRPEVTNFVGDFDKYFSENKKVLFENDYGKILEKTDHKLCLYRKGIRCMETDKDSVYDYDLNSVGVDENRLVKYSWEMPSKIWNLIYQCTNKDVIKNILLKCDESNFVECISSDFASVNESMMSPEYLDVLSELTIAPKGMSGLLSTEERGKTVVLPSLIFEQALSKVNNGNLPTKFKIYKEQFYIESEPTTLMNQTLKQAIEFFQECDKEYLKYPIAIARFENKWVMGMALVEEKKILVSELTLEKGVQAVVETIIEEYIHVKYQVQDETRGFQNSAIQEIVRLLKTSHAYSI